MGNIFKKKSDSSAQSQSQSPPANPNLEITDQDRAILQLKVQKDRLHKYTQKINIVIQREVEIAKQLLKENKKQNALLALKRKRYQENLLDKTEKQMLNLEDLVHHIQFATMQQQVLDALKAGNAVLNSLNSQTSIEDVEQLMEDTREAVNYQNEVAQLLGAELDQADEEEIQRTIQQWEEESLASEVSTLPTPSTNLNDSTVSAPTSISTTSTAKAKSVETNTNQKEVVLA